MYLVYICYCYSMSHYIYLTHGRLQLERMDAFLSGLHPAQSINQSPKKVYGHVRVILLDLQRIRCLGKLEHVLPNGGLMVILVQFHDDIPWYNLQSVKKSP